MNKMTYNDCVVLMSANFLCESFPGIEFLGKTEDEIYDFINENRWMPFESQDMYCAGDILEIIKCAADSLHQELVRRGLAETGEGR